MRHVWLAFLPAIAWSCTCGSFPSAKEDWGTSPLVFVGIVEKTDPKMDEAPKVGHQTSWLRVREPFKGVQLGQLLEVRDQITSCFGGFREGEELLFYLHPGQTPGTWVVPACHRNRSIRNAADDLRFLRGLPDSARGNRVSGIVGVWEDDPVKGFHRSRELRGVRVSAVGVSESYETVTDAQGLYEFRDLRPGSYLIRIDYPKGTKLRFPIAYGGIALMRRVRQTPEETRLEVTETSGNGIDFVLSPDTRITGRVTGPEGRPLKGVCVEIEPLQGGDVRGSRIFDCTEPDGSYVLDKMPAGSYRIVANRGGQITATAPFGRLYYPGTPAAEKAGILTVAAGDHLEGVDIHVTELAPRIELRGRLVFSNGVPLANQSLVFQGDDDRYREYGRTDAEGKFVMMILAGRPGTLAGELSVFPAEEAACPQFNAKRNSNGYLASLNSLPYAVAGDKDLAGFEVAFSFPSCEAWVKRQASRK